MRAIVAKELREMAPFAAPLAAAAALFGALWRDNPRFQTGMLVTAGGLAGALLGAGQGWLDRRARGDVFLLHRPVAPAAIHAARAAAGFAWTLVAVGALVAARAAFPLPDERWHGHPGAPLVPLTAAEAVPAFGAGALAWAAVRLGVARRRLVLGGTLAIVLPTVLVARLLTEWPDAPPVAPALAVAVLLAAFATIDLAQPEAAR